MKQFCLTLVLIFAMACPAFANEQPTPLTYPVVFYVSFTATKLKYALDMDKLEELEKLNDPTRYTVPLYIGYGVIKNSNFDYEYKESTGFEGYFSYSDFWPEPGKLVLYKNEPQLCPPLPYGRDTEEGLIAILQLRFPDQYIAYSMGQEPVPDFIPEYEDSEQMSASDILDMRYPQRITKPGEAIITVKGGKYHPTPLPKLLNPLPGMKQVPQLEPTPRGYKPRCPGQILPNEERNDDDWPLNQ